MEMEGDRCKSKALKINKFSVYQKNNNPNNGWPAVCGNNRLVAN